MALKNSPNRKVKKKEPQNGERICTSSIYAHKKSTRTQKTSNSTQTRYQTKPWSTIRVQKRFPRPDDLKLLERAVGRDFLEKIDREQTHEARERPTTVQTEPTRETEKISHRIQATSNVLHLFRNLRGRGEGSLHLHLVGKSQTRQDLAHCTFGSVRADSV